MESLVLDITDELSGFYVEVEQNTEEETIEIYLENPSGDTYNNIVEAIEQMVDDAGFSLDGDYEGHLSIF